MNSICNHINARYDSRQLQMAQAYEAYLEDQRLCMLFDAVNAHPVKKQEPAAPAVKKDYFSGLILFCGLLFMTMFLVAGFIFGL